MQNLNEQQYNMLGRIVCCSGVHKIFENDPEGQKAFLGFLVKAADEYFSEPNKVNFNKLKEIGQNHLIEMMD